MVEQQKSGVSWLESVLKVLKPIMHGEGPLKNYEMAILVVLKGDSHDSSVKVSDCFTRVNRCLLQVRKSWALVSESNNTHASVKIELRMCSSNNGLN